MFHLPSARLERYTKSNCLKWKLHLKTRCSCAPKNKQSLVFLVAMTVAVMEFCTPPVPGEKHKYYGDVHNNFIKLPRLVPPGKSAATPPAVTRALATKSSRAIAIEQQKTLHSVASSGNLLILKQILLRLPDPLKAVNDPHPATGLTPIHFAASRGHVDIVRCLVEEYQVSVDSRDKEGEVFFCYSKLFSYQPFLWPQSHQHVVAL